QHAMELASWVHHQSVLREQQFQDAVTKLGELNARLAMHFDREGAIAAQLTELRGKKSPEMEAAERQADRDHANILGRIKHLVDRMQEAKSEVDSWKTSMQELNLIIDQLEQHEEQEAESVGWLMPHESCGR
ncbi:MAG: hypothetical protein ABL921_13760, partial [Pirellula sp.]